MLYRGRLGPRRVLHTWPHNGALTVTAAVVTTPLRCFHKAVRPTQTCSVKQSVRESAHGKSPAPAATGTSSSTTTAAQSSATSHRYASQQLHTSTSDSESSSVASATAAAPPPAESAEQGRLGSAPPRRQRVYTTSADAVDQQLREVQRELLHTRLRLAKAEATHAALYEGILARLGDTDRLAHHTASSLRYTGMALRCAHDNLEVELRRLLTIGLTAAEVDAAALEAGARQYVRQNIGYYAQHVASAPSAVPNLVAAARGTADSKFQPLR